MSQREAPAYVRRIRSFVRREGRITRAQQRALDELWPRFGLVPDAGRPLDLAAVFGREAPRVLEIGFGDGEALARLAAEHPEQDFLGIEVHRPGIGHLLLRIEAQGLDNVRVMEGDAVDILGEHIPDAALDRVNIWFPDPWPKKRHHKRRLIQTGFLDLLANRLRAGGLLHLATDWVDYAEQMLAVLRAHEAFEDTSGGGGFVPRPEARPQTKFERRGHNRGHEVRDLLFRRRG